MMFVFLKEILKILVPGFGVLFVMELVKQGIISNYFDLNILLLIIIVGSLLLLIFSLKKKLWRNRK